MAAGKNIVLMTSDGDHGDNSQFRHIPGAASSGLHTLCGFCDCQGAERHLISDEGEPDCPTCLDVVKVAVAYRKYAK